MSLRSFELYIHMNMDEYRDLEVTLGFLDPLSSSITSSSSSPLGSFELLSSSSPLCLLDHLSYIFIWIWMSIDTKGLLWVPWIL